MTFNLKSYPLFYNQFVTYMKANHLYERVSSQLAQEVLQNVFKISATVEPMSPLYMVTMESADFTWFVLKWT